MDAFEKWMNVYYIEHGFISSEAEMREAFRAGMRAAAKIAISAPFGGRLVELDKSVFGRAMNVYVETLEKAKAGDAESIRSICDAAARIFAVANEGRSP